MKQRSVLRCLLPNNDTVYFELRDFISKRKRGEKGKVTERPRESEGRECECRTGQNTASVVKQTIRE